MTSAREELVQELSYVTGKERAGQLVDALADQLRFAADTGMIPSMIMCGQIMVPLEYAQKVIKGEVPE